MEKVRARGTGMGRNFLLETILSRDAEMGASYDQIARTFLLFPLHSVLGSDPRCISPNQGWPIRSQ